MIEVRVAAAVVRLTGPSDVQRRLDGFGLERRVEVQQPAGGVLAIDPGRLERRDVQDGDGGAGAELTAEVGVRPGRAGTPAAGGA